MADRLVEWHLTGGAQPLAITMNEGVCLAVEVDPQHIQRRLETGYCDEMASTLDEALHQVREACGQEQPLSIGLIGNAAEVYPELVRRGTTQAYIARALESMVTHVRAMLEMQARGAIVFDYGNNLRGQALAAGETHAMDFQGFVPAYIRPLFCRGKGPFRWVALSGDPEDIYRTDEAILKLFPEDAALARWHGRRFTSRVCPRVSAGWATASAIRPGWPSTTWLPGELSRRRL